MLRCVCYCVRATSVSLPGFISLRDNVHAAVAQPCSNDLGSFYPIVYCFYFSAETMLIKISNPNPLLLFLQSFQFQRAPGSVSQPFFPYNMSSKGIFSRPENAGISFSSDTLFGGFYGSFGQKQVLKRGSRRGTGLVPKGFRFFKGFRCA